MKQIILLLFLLVPAFLFAQYPATGNKSRLGYQTTGDGLIWRGVAADTAIKPRTTANAYFQLDTVNRILRRYIATQGSWQVVGGGTSIDSLVYSTIKGLNDSIQAEKQTLSFASPLLGISDGNNVDLSPLLTGYVTGSGTNNRVPKWSATSNLTDSNIQDNGTAVSILSSKPFMLGQWTTAGRPSGVNGYAGFNTSFNWFDIYSSTGWFSPLQSSLTGGIGTAGRVIYTDANGRATDSGNLTYTGTRFQTGGSIRIGYNNASNDTASIEKVIDVNSKIIRFNAPGGPGNFGGGFVFRGGQNGTINTFNTFRIYAPGTTAAGSVFVGNVTEPSAQAGNPTTIFGILNKITSTTAYDAAINVHPNETGAGANYSLALGKQLGIFIGNNYANTAFTTISGSGAFGVYIGYQRQPLTSGYGSSMVFSAKGEGASDVTEVMRLQGKDGNICLGCTNAQYQLYTANTGAYGIPRGTVAQRPTIIASTTPLRNNTDSTALEYGESVGVWRQIATRAYARSLVSGLSTSNIYTANGSLTGDRNLYGAGYTLRINANTIFRDSLKIGNLIEPSDADSIVITKGGWIGKQKFLVKNYRDSIRTYGPNGFFSDKFASGFMSSRNRNTNLFYADTTGFVEISNRSRITGLTSALYLGVDNNGKYITLRSQNTGSINDFTVSQTGLDYSSVLFAKIFAVDSTGTLTAVGYGGGVAKTLGALGKTLRSALGVATDGTMVNIPDNTERYNNITSTTSPVTLSNTVSDNLINQGSTQATFTLNFPASPVDGQVLKITYNNAITTLTLYGNGNTIVGSAVTTGVAGSQRAFKFYTGIGWIKLY